MLTIGKTIKVVTGYEYKFEEGMWDYKPFVDRINQLGKEGWEITDSNMRDISVSALGSRTFYLILKRPITQEVPNPYYQETYAMPASVELREKDEVLKEPAAENFSRKIEPPCGPFAVGDLGAEES